MCGIFGIINFEKNIKNIPLFRDLLLESCRRGTDAAGVCVFTKNKGLILKIAGSGKGLLKSEEYQNKILPVVEKSRVLIGQARLATDGSPEKPLNNQPIKTGNVCMVHNGIIINARELSKKYQLKLTESDSRVLGKVLDKESRRLGSIKNAIIKVSGEIAGTLNLIVVTKSRDGYEINVASNNGSLYIGRQNKNFIFASERVFLEKVASKNNLDLKISQVEAGRGMVIGVDGIQREYFLKESVVSGERTVLLTVDEGLLKHRLDKRIDEIERCVKCLLPVNTPNISFNKDGMCNYCRDYKKIKYDDVKKLDGLVKKYRRDDGKADCILAFSGGRDSAWGLHYLVKELGMHPIAVTFDWGMISNIGRRNQARLLGKLGIEQIIVSADLKKVRADIRKNLMAWIRKPDLGMVPLLMQADKITEYYVDKIKKELGVELVFFCRGNELEREEFKAGYCGVKNADPRGVIHNYPVIDKLRLLFYYLRQFLTNPHYLNSSLWSSMVGYLITYVVPHDYIYLWHYVKWEEEKIIKTLVDEYGWEDDGEIGITWRIDDGSPAFYNYLYGQIQGFTENDSFRSNQIREGLISRKKAYEIVKKENMPRYAAMQWYFRTIGVDGDEILSIIDRVEKKYLSDKIQI